jgi:hypothetical protein
MYYIQGEDGWYLRGWVGNMPVWTEGMAEAKSFASQDDMSSDERKLNLHHTPFWVILA